MGKHPILEITSLSKTYERRHGSPITAVDNLNLQVTPGEVFGFLGPNGAGKTTTIKMICGLVAPTSGTICLNGYDVARQRHMAMRQIGAVLEGSRNVYWRFSVWQNLLYFARLKGGSPDSKARARQILQQLGLWERRHEQVRYFSRGMQQKVAIACALITDPPVLLLDEPTLGLDVEAARVVKEWVVALAHHHGKAVVLTTHQLAMAQEACDHIAIMNNGRLLVNQPVEKLFDLFRQEFYQIRVAGQVNGEQQKAFTNFTVTRKGEETIFYGVMAGQDDLHYLLNTIHEMGLPLLSARRIEPSLEEIFIRLVKEA